jgi:hypothetical protein
VSVNAASTPDANALSDFGGISKTEKGSKRKRFGPFSYQFARRRGAFGVLERGARFRDL